MTNQDDKRDMRLEEDLSAYERASDSTERQILLERILNELYERYARSGNLADLERAIQYYYQALELTPPSSEQALIFVNLGNAFRERYNGSHNLADLERAIQFYYQALELTPPSSEQALIFANLGNAFRERYNSSGNRSDITQATNLLREALLLAPTILPEQKIVFSILRNSIQQASDVTIITFETPDDGPLTPHYLATSVIPYLNSVGSLQRVIDEANGREPGEIKINAITQYSPVSVSLQGGAEAIESIKEVVTPWRRDHAKTMARLQEQEKQMEIELKRTEILEKRAGTAKSRIEAQKQSEEVEKLKLENEKIRFELQRSKIQMALDLLDHLSPNLPETEKIALLIKLLPSLDILITSNLELGVG